MTLVPPQAFRKVEFIHRVGLAADRPAAADVLIGTLYFSTDIGVLERSNGTNWTTYAGSGGGGGGSPAGLNTYIQYNDNGVFGANTDFKYDNIRKQVDLGGDGINSWREGIIQFDTYGYVQINSPDGYLCLCGGVGEDSNSGALLFLTGVGDGTHPGWGSAMVALGSPIDSEFIVADFNTSIEAFSINKRGETKIAGFVAIGTDPAQTGAIRLANNTGIYFRNTANTGDIEVIRVANDNNVYVGADTGNITIKAPGGAMTLTSNTESIYFSNNLFMPYGDGLLNLGANSNRWKDLYLSGTIHSAALEARIAALEARIAALEAP